MDFLNLFGKTIFVILVVNLSLTFGQSIKLSEIMFAPSAANSEFIELKNISNNETINLSRYQIKYSTSSADEIISISAEYDLLPNQFAVIFEADYDFQNGIYKDIIPQNTLVFTLDDNAFGSAGMANSSDRIIYLLNSENDTLDYFTYSADNENGISDERISFANNEWGNSQILNGTPGLQNSIAPKDFDLAIVDFSIEPPNVIIGHSAKAKISVQNLGSKNASEFEVNLYMDINQDSIAQSEELISADTYTNLDSSSILSIDETIINISEGLNRFIIQIYYDNDENNENNLKIAEVYGTQINEVKGDLVINEIMYAPKSPEPEWIEIYNKSEKKIFIKNYKVADNNDTAKIKNTSLLLLPKQYLIISDDSTIIDLYPTMENIIVADFPTLNNTNDEVIIMDSLSRVIDSVSYSSDWGGGNGNSLERIDFNIESNYEQNWATSIFPTPGKINSVSKKDKDIKIEYVKIDPVYGKLNEEAVIKTKVKNIGKQQITFSFQLFSDVNKDKNKDELLEESQNVIINSDDSLTFLFNTNIYFTGSTQYFLIKLKVEDDDSLNNFKWIEINPAFEKPDILINEIMYAPINDECEWIELYNNGNENVELKNFLLSDRNDTVTINSQKIIIEPSKYLLISDDSSIFSYYNDLTNVIVKNFPTLNNTDDDVILLDSLSRKIDSVSYSSDWGGRNGNSLERINFNENSNNSHNWKESKYPTPGKLNSISKKEFDIAIDTLFVKPQNAIIGDSANIVCKITNIGKNVILFTLNLFEQTSNQENLIDNSVKLSLNPEDSLFYPFKNKIIIQNITKNYIAKIVAEDDDTTNNYFTFSIFPGYPKSSVIVNEIMFYPSNDEPEWIEIFNNSEYEINLKNWRVGDILSKPVFTNICDSDIYLESNKYLVISKDETINNYHKMILSPTIISKFANLNNDEDGIVIKDNREITIDSVLYNNDWGRKGISIERKNINFSSTNKNNWESSVDIEGSTPGRVNSVSPKNIDVAAVKLFSTPNFPVKNDFININLIVKNYGEHKAENGKVKFYYEKLTTEQLFAEISLPIIEREDSIQITSFQKLEIKDTLKISAQIELEGDEDIVNNQLEKEFIPGFNKNALLITEVMFKVDSDNPEWIELFNNVDTSLNINDWLISNGKSLSIITQENYLINPHDYAVISDFSNSILNEDDKKIIFSDLPDFNDKSGKVIIYDYRKATIDSMKYDVPKNIKPNISLERIDLEIASSDNLNWTFSLSSNGSTPVKDNSIVSLPGNEFGDVVFTEIMFNPNENNSEYLEIYNRSENSVELGNWKIKVEEKLYPLSKYSFNLEANKYFILSADSSIYQNYGWLNNDPNIKIAKKSSLNLTNSGKTFYLIDYRNKIIDSLSYSSSWHNSAFIETKNISLELINIDLDRNKSSNWSSSVSAFGGTPLRENSIFIDREIEETKLNISPNPFSPDNDGFEDFTIISYNLKEKIAQIRIRIFDSKGRLVRELANNIPSGSRGKIIFDGLDDNKHPLKIGIYIILFEAVNTKNAVVEKIKDVVVVARKF